MAEAVSAVNKYRERAANLVLDWSIEKKSALVTAFSENNRDFCERATLAARGAEKGDGDQDLDSILEAMIMLGVIDENGREV